MTNSSNHSTSIHLLGMFLIPLFTHAPFVQATTHSLEPRKSSKNLPSVMPELFLTIVIDQLRADAFDSPTDASPEFLQLINKGRRYAHMSFESQLCFTAPGHASISTGTEAMHHGIIGNEWYDRGEGKRVTSVSDASVEFRSIQGASHIHESTGVNSKIKKEDTHTHISASPHRLLSTTVSDELKLKSPKSTVSYGIAAKDRSSILLAGKFADLALWIDNEQEQWGTSSAYTLDPSLEKKLTQTTTSPLFPKKNGHEITKETKTREVKQTLALANAVLDHVSSQQKISKAFVGISLSAHDTLGHEVGFDHQEHRLFFRAETELLTSFLEKIRKKWGNKVHIALTGDHGGSPSRHRIQELFGESFQKQNTISPKELQSHWKRLAIEHWPSKGSDALLDFSSRQIWLASATSESDSIARNKLVTAIQASARELSGLSAILTREDRNQPDIRTRYPYISQTFHEERSGDLLVELAPFARSADKSLANHETAHAYDCKTSLVVWSPKLRTGRGPAVFTSSLAMTWAELSGSVPPPFAHGRSLIDQ